MRYFARIPITHPHRFRRWTRRTFKLYYNEKQIIDEIVAWFLSDLEITKKTLDKSDAFLYRQRLLILGRMIRNDFGLWEKKNPHTVAEHTTLKYEVSTDPRHPDNLSGYIVKAVLARLEAIVKRKEGVPVHTAGDQRWN